jgi:hypothetical protein
MHDIFELASGTVLGRDHRRNGKNNQDAHRSLVTKDCLVAVVADGCGGGILDANGKIQPSHSEVGAILGSRIAIDMLYAFAVDGSAASLEDARLAILDQISGIANAMGETSSMFIKEHFLFTLVGALVLPDISVFFSIGDGYLNVNGTNIPIGPYPGNMPPYISYGMIGSDLDPELHKFKIFCSMPTSELMCFVIGSDGVVDMDEAAAKTFPGRTDLIGSMSRLWEEDRFFKNPFELGRHLTLVNGGIKDMNLPGRLRDDTTLVVGRRKKVSND